MNVASMIASGLGAVGRYFNVVSVLPASIFIFYDYLLVRSGAWSGPMHWPSNLRALDFVALGLVAVLLALGTNSLQFALIQLFEGYWGHSRLGIDLALARVMHHRRRKQALAKEMMESSGALGQVRQELIEDELAPAHLVRRDIEAKAKQVAFDGYPEALANVLPTRLGNVLRKYESAIGKPYGLDPLVSVPRLVMVSGDRELAYVEAQRMQMELAIRTAIFGIAATVSTIVLLSRQGLWLLIAFAPLGVAYLAYRGAIALAHEYGMSLAVLTDMNRFALYERLHLPVPDSPDAERETNRKLMELFRFHPSSLTYSHPEPSTLTQVALYTTASTERTGQEGELA